MSSLRPVVVNQANVQVGHILKNQDKNSETEIIFFVVYNHVSLH